MGDVRRLGVQQHFDLGVFPMETVLFIADIPDGHSRQMGDEFRGHAAGTTGLAGNHDPVGRGEGFARHTHLARFESHRCGLAKIGIDHFIGDAVADLVGMAF